MARSDYHLHGRWRVLARPDEVFDLVARPEELARWWPAAFTDSLPIQTGDETGEAKVVRLEGRGFLPVLLRWHTVTTVAERPRRLESEVWGDFEGTGVWTFGVDGPYTTVECEWWLRPKMALARLLAPVLRPLMAANFRWAMKRGERSLDLELQRTRAATEAYRAAVPAPPPGIERRTWAFAFAAGALLGLLMLRRGNR